MESSTSKAPTVFAAHIGHQNRFAGLVSSDVLVFPLKTKMTIPLGLVILREAVSRIPDTRNLLFDWGADGMPVLWILVKGMGS
ncbi:MAG: hypothetical protein Ct9H300mP29_9000 [Candidatus Neomarinimicrobiota bacterium]|nr:MAG: hypothetical protein Ct9H300mP29_9000 [Candidatus Neomarinimicrobiota bacterium]